jgi:thiol-disulfide isomerase/thioredoxin
MSRRFIGLLIGFTALIVLGPGPAIADPLAIGTIAPALSEPTASGTFASAASTKPFVLEFFAVWCPHCQREVPVLNRLQEVDGGRVDIIAVPASTYGFDKTSMLQPADLDTFAKRFNARYRIGFDGFFSLAYDYGVASFPTFYIVGADRRIAAVEAGEVPFEKLHADVMSVVGAP